MPLVCEPSVCAGGLRRPLPCVHSAVESPLSILLATSDHRCGVSGGSREEPHGEEPSVSRAGGSLVAPVRRERPWARFHNHNHPPKRSHCHRAPGRVWRHQSPLALGRVGAPGTPATAATADRNTRAARARVTHLRLTLQLGLVHRRVSRTQPTSARERARTGPRG